jgi:predicted NAD-dependent protein-ADP-ribosyltransferase YbiA (DUF1768 family)
MPNHADFRIVKGPRDPLSNFYPFQLDFDGIRSKSVEHVFNFIRASEKGKYDLAERVFNAYDAPEVKRLVKKHDISCSPEFELHLMEKLLEAKAAQCPEFVHALRTSGDATLYHSTYPSDTFWATGLCHWDFAVHAECFQDGFVPGQNLHGCLLMRLRSRLADVPPVGSQAAHGWAAESPVPVLPLPVKSVPSPPKRLPLLPSPLLKKPPSLLDVKVDPRFVMPWYYKHGYFVSPPLHNCTVPVSHFRRYHHAVVRT